MGIRKPPAARRRRRAPRLPHYPSWGSKTLQPGRETQSSCEVSLPLMGIENWTLPPLPPVTRGVSLPLMGIENTGDQVPERFRWQISLPLMGIENPNRCFGQCLPSSGAHYPSWGSKTTRHAATPPPSGALITPHGDRKRANSPAPSRPSSRAHYPSWGSKTGGRPLW